MVFDWVLMLAYDGSAFCGWKDTRPLASRDSYSSSSSKKKKQHRSVEAVIREALAKVFAAVATNQLMRVHRQKQRVAEEEEEEEDDRQQQHPPHKQEGEEAETEKHQEAEKIAKRQQRLKRFEAFAAALKIRGASRTDSGVHAAGAVSGQYSSNTALCEVVCHRAPYELYAQQQRREQQQAVLPTDLLPQVQQQLNALLPPEVRVLRIADLKSLQQPYRNRQPQSMVQQEPQGKQEQKMQREELLLLPQLVTGKQYRYTVSLLPQTHPLLRNSSWQVLQDVRIHEMLRRVARMPATVAVSGEALASDPAGVLDAATGEKQRPLEVLQHRFCMGCMRSAAALAEGSHDFSHFRFKHRGLTAAPSPWCFLERVAVRPLRFIPWPIPCGKKQPNGGGEGGCRVRICGNTLLDIWVYGAYVVW
ncbi:basic-leucine zipper transcription factor A [Cyclospora cayetanensis]|uniref:Basic-leucine zipper transcription factor A n=1 Tax=Cyclospora cayetanensis TaxID=88456 RepID=A0A6P6RVJ3_9EIME|nr:basic-leucine zipper transcription factor A [Cyclospora cayetanensis]